MRGQKKVHTLQLDARGHDLFEGLGQITLDHAEDLRDAFGYPNVSLIDQILRGRRQSLLYVAVAEASCVTGFGPGSLVQKRFRRCPKRIPPPPQHLFVV